MDTLLLVVIATLLAGLAMPLGAVIACVEKIGKNWLEEEFRHSVTAFGGGALLSAVALVLVPDGIENLSSVAACSWFILGGLSFMALDIFLNKINTPASQLAAMLSDFIPESIALGAAFAMGSESAFLLAVSTTSSNALADSCILAFNVVVWFAVTFTDFVTVAYPIYEKAT